MTYPEQFKKSQPKAIDFPQHEYEANELEILSAALAEGYRLAGVRLKRVVFTTKPAPLKETVDNV